MSKKCICPPTVPGWVVSFADLMTLLFCAFVVLYALKKDGISKEVVVTTTTAAIREAFNEVPDAIPEDKTSKPLDNKKAVFKHVKAELMRKPRLKKFIVQNAVLNIMNKDLKELKELVKFILSQSQAQSQGEADGKAEAISIHREDDGIRLRLMAAYLYKPGEFQLDREAKKQMKKIGLMLKDIGRRVSIEGHSDATPQQGRFSKWEISSLRATYALKYFIDDIGYPSGKIRASGYGDSKPIASNDTEEGRKLNRRLEIKIHYDDE